MAACPDLQNQPVSAARPPLPLPRPVVGTRSRARQKPSRVWVGQGGRAVATERAMTPSLFSLQGPALREGSRFQARAPLLPAPASRPSSDRLAATGVPENSRDTRCTAEGLQPRPLAFSVGFLSTASRLWAAGGVASPGLSEGRPVELDSPELLARPLVPSGAY